MRVYGHLRQEHSRTQIKKVSFEAPNNVIKMHDPIDQAGRVVEIPNNPDLRQGERHL